MDKFSVVKENIEKRRSYSPVLMNGQRIEDNKIWDLLELANWAPNHANTEPWRFVVYADDAKTQLFLDEAEIYKQSTPEEKFVAATYEKIQHQGDKLSHVIVVYMKRGTNPNIPALEEICAVSASVQNILLGAEALGIQALWSTGGVTLRPAFKAFLELGEDDVVIGQLFMGYSDSQKEGKRLMPLEDKVIWNG